MDWQRPMEDRIECGIYRIDKSHNHRLFGGPAPVYHAHAAAAFLGVFPTAGDAMEACEEHHKRSLVRCA